MYLPRTKKDIEKEILMIRSFSKKMSEDTEKAKAFLIEAGIYTPTGKLTKWYK